MSRPRWLHRLVVLGLRAASRGLFTSFWILMGALVGMVGVIERFDLDVDVDALNARHLSIVVPMLVGAWALKLGGNFLGDLWRVDARG